MHQRFGSRAEPLLPVRRRDQREDLPQPERALARARRRLFEQAVVRPLTREGGWRRYREGSVTLSREARLERAEDAGPGRRVFERSHRRARAHARRTARSQSAPEAREAAARTPAARSASAWRSNGSSSAERLATIAATISSRSDAFSAFHAPTIQDRAFAGSVRRIARSADRRASGVPSSQTRWRSSSDAGATPSTNHRQAGCARASHRPRSPATLVAAGSRPDSRSSASAGITCGGKRKPRDRCAANASARIALVLPAHRSATIAASAGEHGAAAARAGPPSVAPRRAPDRARARAGLRERPDEAGTLARAGIRSCARASARRLFGIGWRRPRAPEPDQRRLDEHLHAAGSPLTSAW